MEGVARDFLDGVALGDDLPVDLELVAHCYGLALRKGAIGAIAGDCVVYSVGATEADTRFEQAHELMHLVVRSRNYSRSREERIVDSLAARTLLPDAATKRFMGACGFNLAELVDVACVPWKVAAYRFTELWTSVARVWDGRSRPRSRPSPWLGRWIPVSSIECADAEEARRTQAHVRRGGMSGAYYVGGPSERVITVWDLDELEEAKAGYI